MFLKLGAWVEVGDADPIARLNNPNRRQFVGPGARIVLASPDADAVFIWKKFTDRSGEDGVCCSLFRNEGPVLSSLLILEAEAWAWEKWPGERLYTTVNPRKIRSTNPGCCFLKAGWRNTGRVTKRNRLMIFEKFPPKQPFQ